MSPSSKALTSNRIAASIGGGHVFVGPRGALLAIERPTRWWCSALVVAPESLPCVLHDANGRPAVVVGEGWCALGPHAIPGPYGPGVRVAVCGNPSAGDIPLVASFVHACDVRAVVAHDAVGRLLRAAMPDVSIHPPADDSQARWHAEIAGCISAIGTVAVVVDDDGDVRKIVETTHADFAVRMRRVFEWGLPFPVPSRSIGEGIAVALIRECPLPAELADLPRATRHDVTAVLRWCCSLFANTTGAMRLPDGLYAFFVLPVDGSRGWDTVLIRVDGHVENAGTPDVELVRYGWSGSAPFPAVSSTTCSRPSASGLSGHAPVWTTGIVAPGALPYLYGAASRFLEDVVRSRDHVRMGVAVEAAVALAHRDPEIRGASVVIPFTFAFAHLPVPPLFLPIPY